MAPGAVKNCSTDWTDIVTAIGESLDESVSQASHDVELLVKWENGTQFFRPSKRAAAFEREIQHISEFFCLDRNNLKGNLTQK